MRYVQRSDVYVAVGAVALVGAAGLVWHGLREIAASNLSVATAIDCSNEVVFTHEILGAEEREDYRERCRSDADARQRISGRHY
jgi:hypothetical protein